MPFNPGEIPNPQTHPTLGPNERLGLASGGEGSLELPALPYVQPGALPAFGFDLAGVFGAFWQNYVLPRYNLTVLLLPLITPETPGAETAYERSAAGVIVYTKPVVYWQPPVTIKKGDLIVRPDGRRYVVGDSVTPGQVWGTTIINYAELESRSVQDITYQIPL